MNKLKNDTFCVTKFTKTGIKIKKTDNDYKHDPFANVDPFKYKQVEKEMDDMHYDKSNYEVMNLNIEEYSREELYKLFGLRKNATLTEDIMRQAKKIVLKTHPDKSRLENKYFIFFSKAYKRLYEIYQFQHKTTTTVDSTDYFDQNNEIILDTMFEMKKELKHDTNQFNQWFNQQFEAHRIDDPIETGYGDWLKSDEDILYTPPQVNKDSMAREMQKRKKELQQLMPYTGIHSSLNTSSIGGSALMEYNTNNFSSSSLFSNAGYTDLKQAYVESVIPVTEEDYHNKPKFKSVDEYTRHRNAVDLSPQSKEEAMAQLLHQQKIDNEESAALAFYYAQQTEKANQQTNQFWSKIKQITNYHL